MKQIRPNFKTGIYLRRLRDRFIGTATDLAVIFGYATKVLSPTTKGVGTTTCTQRMAVKILTIIAGATSHPKGVLITLPVLGPFDPQ
jgi:hypothetical protein